MVERAIDPLTFTTTLGVGVGAAIKTNANRSVSIWTNARLPSKLSTPAQVVGIEESTGSAMRLMLAPAG